MNEQNTDWGRRPAQMFVQELPDPDSIYGDALPGMEKALRTVLEHIGCYRRERKALRGTDPVEHCLARIKSDKSMREKCIRKGIPETRESALQKIHDAIGIRIVCAFLNDIYGIRNYLAALPDVEVLKEKDYILKAKPNGYRSYHMILRVNTFFVEVQLRTISMDTWAALEHQLHYKKEHALADEELIVSELKRCADELASTDVSMQTIRDMIYGEGAFS